MKWIGLILFGLLSLTGCSRPAVRSQQAQNLSILEARRGFTTQLARKEAAHEPVPQPPSDLFQLVRYPSPAGSLAAYVGRPTQPGKKYPAILWIFGGFDNGIGETAWEQASPENDQSASAFRQAGIIMMYPSLRGGNDNPGYKEGFFGEVDDVLAAVDYLAHQDFVDPNRIYLGGHSTGGTLALLVAAASSRFRAVFAFGPVEDVTNYGEKNLPFDVYNAREAELRAPARWIDTIRNPTFVIEGTEGNYRSLQGLESASRNPAVHFLTLQGADHFSTLAPMTRLIAEQILKDNGPATSIAFSEADLKRLFP